MNTVTVLGISPTGFSNIIHRMLYDVYSPIVNLITVKPYCHSCRSYKLNVSVPLSNPHWCVYCVICTNFYTKRNLLYFKLKWLLTDILDDNWYSMECLKVFHSVFISGLTTRFTKRLLPEKKKNVTVELLCAFMCC